MSSNKKTKSKFNFIIICIIGFVVSIFFEFYFINYFPYDYFMLFGTGIIMCIFGYLSIDGVLEIINQTSRKRDEQNEIMIKASKAIYLTTKKIALNSHSMPDTLETPKDFGSLIDDLSQANERLAKEVENAVSLQSLVQKNRTIVNNAREIIENHEQPLSPLEVEKDLKLDEAIAETDFETVTQPEAIDSMIKQEVAEQEMAIQETADMTIQKENNRETPMTTDILEETIDAVGNIMNETEEAPKQVSDISNFKTSEQISDSSASEQISDISDSSASEQISDAIVVPQTIVDSPIESEISLETASDIFSEVKEAASHILNNSTESDVSEKSSGITESNITKESNTIEENNLITEGSKTVDSNIADSNLTENRITSEIAETSESDITAVNTETANSSKAPASKDNIADKPMTSEEIAALFANL